jgi:lipopolysaccharide/colanic/teichoic acid biosynthesis glycosyltransferase
MQVKLANEVRPRPRGRLVLAGGQDAAPPAIAANPLPTGGRIVKRALDIVLALVGLVLVLPALIVAMVAVRLDSPGPVLFRQIRVGLNGRRFRLYKLRTMYHGSDDRVHREYVARLIAGADERNDGIYKLTRDPRITRVGRFLRQYSIDEVPQLWNVLKGDMSLVGPRPALPHETELYPAGAWARVRVKPGITGLWQVSGRCELSFEDMVSLDVRYWQRWTLLQDFLILLKTPKTIFSGRGAA